LKEKETEKQEKKKPNKQTEILPNIEDEANFPSM